MQRPWGVFKEQCRWNRVSKEEVEGGEVRGSQGPRSQCETL